MIAGAPALSRSALPLNLALGGGVALLAVASLLVGPSGVGLGDLLDLLTSGAGAEATLILVEIRLPRTLLGLLVGATLGLAGAAMQGYLRNPLAEPGLIGISSSAALGAVIMFYFGVASAFALALPLGGMAGAAVAAVMLRLLAGRTTNSLTLILAGIAITSFAGALTSLALNLAPSPFAALEIVFWLLGSLEDRSFDHLWLAGPFIVIGWVMLAASSRGLDALTLGEEAAASLGVNLVRTQQLVVYGTALSVGAATAVTGVIGFVGLVVPHLLRPLVGHRPGALLGASALGGAALTLSADLVVRLTGTGATLKLGVLTAIVGAPFFLWLVLRTRRLEG